MIAVLLVADDLLSRLELRIDPNWMTPGRVALFSTVKIHEYVEILLKLSRTVAPSILQVMYVALEISQLVVFCSFQWICLSQ